MQPDRLSFRWSLPYAHPSARSHLRCNFQAPSSLGTFILTAGPAPHRETDLAKVGSQSNLLLSFAPHAVPLFVPAWRLSLIFLLTISLGHLNLFVFGYSDKSFADDSFSSSTTELLTGDLIFTLPSKQRLFFFALHRVLLHWPKSQNVRLRTVCKSSRSHFQPPLPARGIICAPVLLACGNVAQTLFIISRALTYKLRFIHGRALT